VERHGTAPQPRGAQTFALRADSPRRASVNEHSGSDVLVPGYLYHYTLDAKAAGGQLFPTAKAVVDALRRFDDTLDPQQLAERASSSATPIDLITLRQSDRDMVSAAIGSLPGVVVTPQAELLATDDSFAPEIISQVKKAVADDLDGAAGWRVVSVNQNGSDIDVLNEVPGAPAPSITISLDRAVQDAAQGAVNTVGRKAMIVAIKPSTGRFSPSRRTAPQMRTAPPRRRGSTRPGRRSRSLPRGRRSTATWRHPTRCSPARAR